MSTNCAHLIADLFLFCYERDFMVSFSVDIDVIEAFNSTSRYKMTILNIADHYFERIVSQIYRLDLPTLLIPMSRF